jgi:hypothetical protein
VLAFEEFRLIRFSYWSSMPGVEDVPEYYVVVTWQLEPEGKILRFTLLQENCRSEEVQKHSQENWR